MQATISNYFVTCKYAGRNDFIHVDDDVATTCLLTNDEIIQDLQSNEVEEEEKEEME